MKTALGILVIAIFLLFGVEFYFLLTLEHEPTSRFISEGNVRGSCVIVDKRPYTLNFKQQEALIHLLNKGKQESSTEGAPTTITVIEKIVLYRFGDESDLILVPVAADFSRLTSGKLELSLDSHEASELQTLLETTFDRP